MHEGTIGGWLSAIKIFPDARAGVYVSTTNGISEEDAGYVSLFINWLSDYILGMLLIFLIFNNVEKFECSFK